jgi:transcriptional regulator NrdR family protein
MICPECKSKNVYIHDSRQSDESTRRRRWCAECGHRFSTFEISLEELQRLKKKEEFLYEVLTNARNLCM